SASHCLDLLLRQQSGNVYALYRRGWILQRLGHLGPAVEEYKKALKIAPGHFKARLGLANTLVLLQEYVPAAEHYQRLHEKKPQKREVPLGLPRCRAELADIQGKPAELARARELLDELLPSVSAPAAVDSFGFQILCERARVALRDGQKPE